MIRLFAAVLSPKDPLFHSVQTGWRYLYRLWSSQTENNLQHFSRPGYSYRFHSPNTFRAGRDQPPKRDRLEFPENLRGARAWRTRPQKGADCGPPAEEHPYDEHAEFCVPAP